METTIAALMTSIPVPKMHSVSTFQNERLHVSVILDLQGISVNVREDFFTPDQNYEIFILKWIKMKDKAKVFSMSSNKLMYIAFLLKLKPE